MSSYLLKLTCTGCALAFLALPQHTLAQGNPNADRHIVELKPGVDPVQVLRGHGIAARHIFTRAINGFAAQLPPGQLRALENDPNVAAIVADQQVFAFGKPVKPPPPGGVYPDPRPTAGDVVPAGVERVGARRVSETGIGIGVAVVDSGLDFAHPELPISARSFFSPAVGISAQDDYGHGTHVGGIIAAKEDGQGIVGVAPAATLYAVKVLDSEGSGSDSDIISGLEWILQNAHTVSPRIQVVNMSLGRPASPFDSPFRTAVQNVVNAGITVVAAAGNEQGREVSQMTPAGFPEVIAVASTTAKAGISDISFTVAADTASAFTTDGRFNSRTGVGVAISAPGETQENISGGYVNAVGITSTQLGGGFTEMFGTSMAAPHVAGVVALLKQRYQQRGVELGPVDVKARIMSGDREGVAPLDSPTTAYTYDREREGICFAPFALGY